jgi:hypothetical protein
MSDYLVRAFVQFMQRRIEQLIKLVLAQLFATDVLGRIVISVRVSFPLDHGPSSREWSKQ